MTRYATWEPSGDRLGYPSSTAGVAVKGTLRSVAKSRNQTSREPARVEINATFPPSEETDGLRANGPASFVMRWGVSSSRPLLESAGLIQTLILSEPLTKATRLPDTEGCASMSAPKVRRRGTDAIRRSDEIGNSHRFSLSPSRVEKTICPSAHPP